MTRRRCLDELNRRFDQLSESIVALRFAAVEACPEERSDPFVTDLIGDVEVLAGFAEQARRAAAAAHSASRAADARSLRSALSTSQEQSLCLLEVLLTRLHTPGRVMQLLDVGHRLGGRWSSWSRGTHAEVRKLPEMVLPVLRSLAEAWEEFSERGSERGLGVIFMSSHSAEVVARSGREDEGTIDS